MNAGPTASSPTQATRTTGDSASRAVQPAVPAGPSAEAAPVSLTSIQRGLLGGAALPAGLRERMEAGFGTSFADVRVHTGAEAAGATASLRAEAFTTGSDIAFAPGRFAPGSAAGDGLIAHELAHVVQQRRSGGGGAVQTKSLVSGPGDAAETGADRAAATVLAGGRANVGAAGQSLRGRILRRARIGAPALSPAMTQAPQRPGATAPGAAPVLTPVMTSQVSAAGGQVSGLGRAAGPGAAGPAPKSPDDSQTARGESLAEAAAPPGVAVAGSPAGAAAETTEEGSKEKKKGKDGEAAAPGAEAAAGPGKEKGKDGTDKDQKKKKKRKGGEAEAAGGGAARRGGGGGGGGGTRRFGQNLGDRGEAAAEEAKARLSAKAGALRRNEGADSRIGAAVAAAEPPANAAEVDGQRQQAGTLAAAEIPAPDAAAAQARAQGALAAVAPTTIEELDDFAGPGGAGTRDGIAQAVGAEAAGQAAPVQTAMSAVSTPPAGAAPDPAVPQPAPLAAGGAPAPGLATAAPPPVPEESLDASEFREDADSALSEHDVDDATLEKAHEGPLRAIGDDKKTLNENVDGAATEARQTEGAAIGGAAAGLEGTEAESVGGMEGGRAAGQEAVSAEQDTTRTGQQTGEQTLAEQIGTIYSTAETTVNGKLATLQTDAVQAFRDKQAQRLEAFASGVRAELDAFKDRRYSGARGPFRRLRDWVLSINSLPEVKALYERNRASYIADIDAMIAGIKQSIEAVITECKTTLADARAEIDRLAEANKGKLDGDAQAALERSRQQFTQMETRIESTRRAANAALDRERERAIQEMDAKLAEIEAENAGLVDKIANAIKALAALLGQFMRLLARVTRMGIGSFLSAAGAQAKDGVKNNLWDQLKEAFQEWIFAKVPGLQLLMSLPPNWVEMLAALATSMMGLFMENLPAMLPAIGVAAMTWMATQLALKLIPGAGAIMAVIDAIRAAWSLVQSLFSAASAFFEFVMQVAAPGNGAVAFARALAYGIMAAVDAILTFLGVDALIRRVLGAIAKPFGKIIERIKARFKAFLSRRKTRADGRKTGRKSKSDGDDHPDSNARKSARAKAERDAADDDRRKAAKDKGKDDKNRRKETDAERRKREKAEEEQRNKEKLDKAVTAVRPAADGLLSKGVSRIRLTAQLSYWRLRYGIRVLELDAASGAIEAANSPRKTVTRVLKENPKGVYKLVHDIAVERWKRAAGKADLTPAAGRGKAGAEAGKDGPFGVEGTAKQTPSVQKGDPLEKAAVETRNRDPGTIERSEGGADKMKHRGEAPVEVGPETIHAQQGSGKVSNPDARGNIIVPDLGTYPEIVAQLLKEGFKPADVNALVTGALKPSTSTPLGRRLFALFMVAEPARRPIASATSPLALTAMQQQGASLPNLLGDPKGSGVTGSLFPSEKLNPQFEMTEGGIWAPGGGIMPASAVGAAPAGRRTDATVIEGKEFREGSKIGARSEADLLRTVELVYQAVKAQEFKDMGGLEREIRKLLDMFDKSAGVKG